MKTPIRRERERERERETERSWGHQPRPGNNIASHKSTDRTWHSEVQLADRTRPAPKGREPGPILQGPSEGSLMTTPGIKTGNYNR